MRNSVRSRVVVAAIGLSLLASTVSATAEPPDKPGSDGLPPLQVEKSVSGGPVSVPPLPDDPTPMNVAITKAAWPAAGSGEVRLPEGDAAAASEPVRAGDLPVRVARGAAKDSTGKPAAHAAGRVKVEVLDRKQAEAAGVQGVLLRLSPTDGDTGGLLSVRLDYAGFATAYGADYGQRLTMATLPDCVLSTPDRQECAKATPLTSTNSATRHEVAGELAVSEGKPVLVAAAAGPSSGSGDFTATSLSPAGSWSAGGSSGDFTYSYPLRPPPALGGDAPSLSLGYSSGSVDGRTSATNNQASWIGDGWDLGAGHIERRYKGCHDDGQDRSGDLCWATDNATMTLGGRSTELIKDAATGVWHPKQDDGSRVEKLTGAANGAQGGEYWKVTTTDGTQYVFGLYRLPGWTAGKTETRSVWTVPVFGNNSGEPCHKATFDTSSCQQAYRWNLDYIVDPHGNATTYFYEREGNYYARNGNTANSSIYIRGGWLAQINYGLRPDNLFATPPASVRFSTAERCVPTGTITCAANQLNASTASAWPDVPFDQICDQGATCTNRISPTFFTRKRLAQVITSVGTKQVDSWTLTHSFPPVDEFAPSMWLNSIKHIGLVGGSKDLPATTFQRIAKPNRVDSDADHGRPPIIRNRISWVLNETGGLTAVGYSEPDCRKADRMPANPESNKLRCFPQWWTPPGAWEPVLEYFHKYVVTAVTADPRTVGGSSQPVLSRYEYLDGGAWHFDENDLAPADKRTWSQWRGYGRVKVTDGTANANQSVTETRYLRGMDGDRQPSGVRDEWVTDADGGRVEDHDALQGQPREILNYDGTTVASATVFDPWISAATATNGEKKAFLSDVASERTRTLLSGGAWRRTQTKTTYNAQGIPTQVENLGDLGINGDETCTRNDYIRNDSAWMLTYPKAVHTQYTACTGHVGPGNGLRELRSSYDGAAWGVAPTKGDTTRVDELDRWDINGQTWVTTARSRFDAYGRVLETLDAKDNKTITAYSPASGAQVSKVTTTNPLGHQSTTTLEPAWALPLTTVAVSGATSYFEYDPLGRLVRGWKPGHSPLDNEKPDVVFDYQVNQNTASVITTKTYQDNGAYLSSYALFDGLGRASQTQSPGFGDAGGRVVTDTFYDSRGLQYQTFQPYWNDKPPSATMFAAAADNMVPRRTLTTFDKLERPTNEILYSYNREHSRTIYAYGGDRVHMRPPGGGTATTTISDVRGNVTELRQYHAATVGGPFDATRYAYTKQGDLESITDSAGNVWGYGYDLRGRKIAAEDPDRGHTDYGYDALGQLTTTTDARDKTVAYSYDKLGRRTGMFNGSTSGTKLAEWIFDTVTKGLPTASTRFDQGHAYTNRVTAYDDADRPTTTEIVIPAVEQELGVTYTFDNDYTLTGKPRSIAIPAAGGLPREHITTTYNDVGLPDRSIGTRGDGNPSNYVSATDYSPYGEMLRMVLAAEDSTANVSVGFQYFEDTRRLSQTASYRETNTGYLPVTALAYNYDPVGNLTQITDAPGGVATDTQCFTYDYLRRLTQAWTPASHNCGTTAATAAMGGVAPYWLSWTFDKTGNRLTETNHTTGGDTTRTHAYPVPGQPRPHAVQSVATDSPSGDQLDEYGYDATGNTTTRALAGATSTLDYDIEGRLSEAAESDNGTSNYVYDADGNRLLKREPDSTTLYLPGMDLRRDAATGVVTATRYYTHNGTSIAVRTPGGLTWTLPDHHGTVTATVSSDATKATKRYHDPYGNARGQAPTVWPDSRGYLNAPTDSTGLTHLGAREYDPTTGRFLSVDPIIDTTDPQQFNAYTYSNSNPTTFTDPDGQKYFEGDSGGGWVDSGAVGGGSTSSGGGPTSSSQTASTQKAQDKLNDPARNKYGNRPSSRDIETLREVGYRGSDDFTYADAIEFANQDKIGRAMVCHFLSGTADECFGARGSLADIIRGIAEFAYELTPIADAVHCVSGEDSCLWLLANVAPPLKGLKVAKAVDNAADAAKATRTAEDAVEHGYKYHPRIRQRGVEDPRAHNFPYSFDDVILKEKPIVQKDGSLLYRKAGEINGRDGVYEIALNPDSGTIFHRTWRSR